MENKIDWFGPAIYSVIIGLMFAAFSQSCSVTRASITKYVLSGGLKPIKPIESPQFKYSGSLKFHPSTIDTTKGGKANREADITSDTSNYNRMILNNQHLSLMNEKKILDLLLKKEGENKKLKQVVVGLREKAVITKDEKEDAISMQLLWDLGNKILTLCAVILGLLILQNLSLFVYYRNQLRKNERQTCNPH